MGAFSLSKYRENRLVKTKKIDSITLPIPKTVVITLTTLSIWRKFYEKTSTRISRDWKLQPSDEHFCDKITRLLCQINRDESLLFNSTGKENTFPIWLTFLQKNSSALFATFIATNLFMLPSSLNWSLSQERSTPLLEDKRFFDQFSTLNLEC